MLQNFIIKLTKLYTKFTAYQCLFIKISETNLHIIYTYIIYFNRVQYFKILIYAYSILFIFHCTENVLYFDIFVI